MIYYLHQFDQQKATDTVDVKNVGLDLHIYTKQIPFLSLFPLSGLFRFSSSLSLVVAVL